MTRYIEAFSWTNSIEAFLEREVTERPLLNVCAGRRQWGDVMLDRYAVPQSEQVQALSFPLNLRADWVALPFAPDHFGAVFADPPWDAEYKPQVADFVKDALRVAPVVYLMAPWIYGSAKANLTKIWVRQMPGVNRAICLTRYARPQTA